MPKLYVLSGPDLGRTFEVADGAKVGRGVDCAVHLRDVSVSREHARLVRGDDGWRIEDTGSRNGVSVGGRKVPSAVLRDGDEFQVGEILLRFRADLVAVPAAPDVVLPDEIVLEEELPIARRAPAPAPPAELVRTVLSAPRPSPVLQRDAGILQYKKIPDRPGFLASDLAQQPLWIRLGAGLLAIALFGAIFLFAFKGTSFLKQKATGDPAEVEDEASR